MTRRFYATSFLALTILLLLFLPDGIFNSFVADNIKTNGDGEVAIVNYETAVGLVKLGASAAIAALFLKIISWAMRKSSLPK